MEEGLGRGNGLAKTLPGGLRPYLEDEWRGSTVLVAVGAGSLLQKSRDKPVSTILITSKFQQLHFIPFQDQRGKAFRLCPLIASERTERAVGFPRWPLLCVTKQSKDVCFPEMPGGPSPSRAAWPAPSS